MTAISILNKDIPKALLALVLVLAAVGAATGIVLAGSVSGTAATEVDQSIVIGSQDNVTVVDSTGDSLTTVSADGTEFRTATNVFQGEDYEIELNLTNNADVDLNGELILSADEPLQISVDDPGTGIDVQRLDMDTFLFTINGDTDPDEGTVTVTVAAPNDIEPGFYEIEGQIVPEVA